MTIMIKRQDYEGIIFFAQKELPNEACGLIAGSIEGETKIVGKVYYLRNLDQSPEHFSMNPQEQFAAVKDIRSKGWVLLGNFHSHPNSPSRPSQEDIRLAFDPEASYLILSLQDKENPVLKSFNIIEGIVKEEELRIL